MPYSNPYCPIAGYSARNWKTKSPQMETNGLAVVGWSFKLRVRTFRSKGKEVFP